MLHKPNQLYKQMLMQRLGFALEEHPEDHDVEVQQKEVEVEALLSCKKTKYHSPNYPSWKSQVDTNCKRY
jgi:hypothetical protein